MKLLLTSGGLTNASIKSALAELVGRPFSDASAVFIPTAANPERGDKWWLIKDYQVFHDLGWKSMDIVDLAAVSSFDKSLWWSTIEAADVIVVGGGNNFYLSYWFKKSGLLKAVPSLLRSRVYVGISAGSILTGPDLRATSEAIAGKQAYQDEQYDELGPAGQSSNATLRLVDFFVRPHFNAQAFPKINNVTLTDIAKELSLPLYAIDDQTALKIIDDQMTVVTEGEWKRYAPGKAT